MKILPPKISSTLCFTALLAAAPILKAAVIVDLPAGGFASSGSFVGVPGATTFTVLGGMTGSSANRISPSSTATATSEVFYGAIEGSFNGTGTIYHPTVNVQTANMIEIRSRGGSIGGTGFPGGTTPAAGGFVGFLMWKSGDFLTPGATTFDNTSRITFNLNAAVSTQGRYLINIGSNYYVSNNTLSAAGTINSGDLTALTWKAYDPMVDLHYDTASPTVNILTAGQIQNISGVGIYVQTTTGAGANAFRFNDVEITAIAVPEPETWGFLVLGAALLPVFRRRLRK